MPELSLAHWALIVGALVLGILAGHFGWGKRWRVPFDKLHPDYLTGLDYLVTEQPDRALDMFLKLMDANADTIETHFALGSLYRRRGEVERAIRIHQNLLERTGLAPEHREQALLALAQDYLRAGLLDRAEGLFREIGEVSRLRASALHSLLRIYERQHEWQLALETYRQLKRIKAAPPARVAAHYLCELAALAVERGDIDEARALLRQARRETAPMARAAVLRAQIARRLGEQELAARLLRHALDTAPALLQDELPNLLSVVGEGRRDAELADLVAKAEARDFDELKRLAFAVISADLAATPTLRSTMERVFAQDPTLNAVWAAAAGQADRVPQLDRISQQIGALLSQAEKFRCNECGFAGRSFYWHCPACQSWDSFESHAVVKLR